MRPKLLRYRPNKLLLGWVIFFFAIDTISADTPDEGSPNILFIVADYMGYSDIGSYGAKDINTPDLDRIASEGVRFLNHYSTAPSCIPSRASILSGLYPQQALSNFELSTGRGLHKDKNILVNTLKSLDYRTAYIGKWHLGSEPGFGPNDHGFDLFFGFDSWTLDRYKHQTSDGEPGLYRNKQIVTEEGYLTELFSKEAIDFVDNTDDQPFFIYLSFNGGLPPYQPPNMPKSEWGSGWTANEASREDYASMIEAMDQAIGQVLDKIENSGRLQNTLVVFTYDHGGRHLVDSAPLFHGFGTLWEGGIRVPLIMRWPEGLPEKAVIGAPTSALDIVPTLLEASGLSDTSEWAHFEAVSLLDLELLNQEKIERRFFWQTTRMQAVRQGKWKYIVDNHSQMLFDLESDVSERRNLFAEHPEIVSQLRSALSEWQSSQESQ